MLIALMSDIHGNREAFDACLNHARRQGAERYIILGDLVGYGADPAYIVDVARGMQDKGAIVLLGNFVHAADVTVYPATVALRGPDARQTC